MNSDIRKPIKGVMAVVTMGLAVVGLTACSQAQLTSFVTGHNTARPSYWVVEPDTSGSTVRQTRIDGAYEHEMLNALAAASQDEATVYGAPIDGNAIGEAGWEIDGMRLRSGAGGGNARLAELARARRAGRLRPVVRQMLSMRPTNGSDILGALQGVAQLGGNLPSGAERVLVLLTDGAINLPGAGGYDIYTQPPDTKRERQGLIRRFAREGELPRLSGWRVYLGGIGVGIGDRRTARATVLLWNELIPATGATLVEASSTLAFG